MKKATYLLLLFLSALGNAYAQDALPGELNGKVVFVNAPATGSITVTATGFAKKKAESIKNAAAGAIYTLLFRGIDGSPYNLPMVDDENGKKNNPAVVALLNGGYTAFITENILVSEQDKKRKQDGVKGKETENRITINCDALRRHLEQNGVIRKFGI